MPCPVMKNSDHRRVGAVHRAQNSSLSPPVGAEVDDLDQYPVAMHGRANGMWWDKNISRKAGFERRASGGELWNHKAEAVAMHCQPTHDQVLVRRRLRNGIAVRINRQQLPSGDQLL